jgi:hypothetical protein
MLPIHSAINRAYCLVVMLHLSWRPGKRKSPSFFWRSSQIIIDSLPCGFSELEPHRSPRLPLSYGCSIDRVPARRDVLELQSHNVATAQLTVDGQVEHRQVTQPAIDLKLGPDGRYMLWS